MKVSALIAKLLKADPEADVYRCWCVSNESGTSFETYARVRIRGSMLDELRRMDWVPRTIHEKARKVQAEFVFETN